MDELKCLECGSINISSAQFCIQCGAKLDNTPTTSQISQKPSEMIKKSSQFNTSKVAWILSLVGGILLLISLTTPAAYSFTGSAYIWMWGLAVGKVEIGYFFDTKTYTYSGFITDIRILTVCLICSALVLISAIITLVKVNSSKKGSSSGITWLIMGLISFIAVLLWMILMETLIEFSYKSYGYEFSSSFWGIFRPGFGVIGVFIGSALIIAGGITDIVVRST